MKKKLSLDQYDLGLIINCLYRIRGCYTEESLDRIDDLILYLIDHLESRSAIRPTRKKKVVMESAEYSIVTRCLIEWRNRMLGEGESGKAEIISELVIKLANNDR